MSILKELLTLVFGTCFLSLAGAQTLSTKQILTFGDNCCQEVYLLKTNGFTQISTTLTKETKPDDMLTNVYAGAKDVYVRLVQDRVIDQRHYVNVLEYYYKSIDGPNTIMRSFEKLGYKKADSIAFQEYIPFINNGGVFFENKQAGHSFAYYDQVAAFNEKFHLVVFVYTTGRGYNADGVQMGIK